MLHARMMRTTIPVAGVQLVCVTSITVLQLHGYNRILSCEFQRSITLHARLLLTPLRWCSSSCMHFHLLTPHRARAHSWVPTSRQADINFDLSICYGYLSSKAE